MGYVRRGCFNLLFSAGCPLGERQPGIDVPLAFQPLNLGPIINTQPRLPEYLSTNTGFDMTRDFAMMSYLNNGVRLTSEFTASVSASAWGMWRTEGLVHANCGPQLCCPPSSAQTVDLISSDDDHPEMVSDEYNQCVFVRYYTVRKRPLLALKVIKAGAGPRDLGPGGRDNEESPLEIRSGSYSGSDIASGLFEVDVNGESDSITSIGSDSDTVVHNTTAVRLLTRAPGYSRLF